MVAREAGDDLRLAAVAGYYRCPSWVVCLLPTVEVGVLCDHNVVGHGHCILLAVGLPLVDHDLEGHHIVYRRYPMNLAVGPSRSIRRLVLYQQFRLQVLVVMLAFGLERCGDRVHVSRRMWEYPLRA